MAQFVGLQISADGMTAHRIWMETVATNLANAETTKTQSGEPFKRKLVVFAQNGLSVRVAAIVDDNSPPRMIYDPSHPDADANGYVRYPNIHPVLEMVDLLAAARGYEANAEALRIQRNMLQSVLEIFR